jgi:hypothetical protein
MKIETQKTEMKIPTVAEQIKRFVTGELSESEVNNQLNDLQFGQVTFEVRDGKVYRCLISSSVLLK